MKRLLVLFALVLALPFFVSCDEKKPEAQCLFGNDVPEVEQNEIIDVGEYCMSLMTEQKYTELYELGSEDLKLRQNKDQFKFALEMFFQAFGNVDYPRISEIYYLTSKAQEQKLSISCNLGQPGVNDVYTVPANREIGIAIFEATTGLEAVRVVLQFEKQDQEWKLRIIGLNPKTIKHKLPRFYVESALKHKEDNRLHLAVLYLKTAVLLHDLGLNVQEYTVTTIENQIRQIKVDYMPMPGSEPQKWATDSGANYEVYNLETAYNNGALLVQINYLTETLKDDQLLKKEAWDLAQFLDKKFPEYRLGFDGFRITAAPKAREELLTVYHSIITFPEIDAAAAEKLKNPPPEKNEPGAETEQEKPDAENPSTP